MLATPGVATLAGSLLRKNVTSREEPPSVASLELLISLTADEWDPAVESNLTLQRILVANIRVSAMAVGKGAAKIRHAHTSPATTNRYWPQSTVHYPTSRYPSLINRRPSTSDP